MVAGPLQGRSGAWLTVADAASRVRVQFAALPGLLYRVGTPADSGLAPMVTRRGGRVLVRLRATGADGPDEVRIVLNRNVRWGIRLPAGGGEQVLNLLRGRVARIDLGASGLVELRLPRPVGTVPVTFTGGVGTAVVAAASGVPFRFRLDGGAGSVRTPWLLNNGAGAGAELTAPSFDAATDRYAVRARAGVGALVLRSVDEP